MLKIRSLTMTAPQVRALLREAEAPGAGMSRHAVPIKPQPPIEGKRPKDPFYGASFGLCRSVADGVKMFSLNDYDRLPKHPTDWDLEGSVGVARDAGYRMHYRCPYAPGDMIAVKESWWTDEVTMKDGTTLPVIDYRADVGEDPADAWKSPAIMPRWASRVTLIVTNVEARRVKDTSDEHVEVSGAMNGLHDWDCAHPSETCGCGDISYQELFARFWDAQYGKRYPWSSNPWCWWLSFRPIARNVDDVVANREVA